jgi:hypothetical protein
VTGRRCARIGPVAGGHIPGCAKNGIKFKISDPRESAEIREDIDSQQVKSSVKHLRL